ncbi:MAG: hypothetical protein CMO78_01025 [Verrucomicrobiales bacterium]|nr:hypothetical protein [Verrucomicrobiales bacterium]
MNRLILAVGAFLGVSAPAADTPAAAKAALIKGAAYMRSISAQGGYLWRYSTDLKLVAGENRANVTTQWLQPPGTPAVGMALLEAYQRTGGKALLDHALAAGAALAAAQLPSGGWDYRFDFSDPQRSKRRNISTFDDDTTQSCLRYLLALGEVAKGNSPREQAIRNARDLGLRKLLEAQYPNGAWPQRYDGMPKAAKNFPVLKARYPKSWPRNYPKANYINHYTFNDNSHRDCVLLALQAHRVTGALKFLLAARRGGDFILLAQMPEPQPAWAQQYNARMEPAWARRFEPASITGGESVGACRTLIDLYLATGDAKYLRAVDAAVKWYRRSAIAPDKWARFYELQTNRPLYFTKEYKLTYSDADLPTHYSFQSSYGVERMIRYYEAVKKAGRAAWLVSQKSKPLTAAQRTARARGMEKKIRTIVAAQDAQGRWVTRTKLETRGMKFGDRIETREFIQNIGVLSEYLSLLR